MKNSINTKSDISKSKQIVCIFLELFKEEKLNSGDLLPSINQIIKEFHVARDTAVKVYATLKQMGLVIAVPNKGHFVI